MTTSAEDSELMTSGQIRACPENLHLHPVWMAFVKFCGKLHHGQIECLKIQDGIPVLAEVTRKKVKFT